MPPRGPHLDTIVCHMVSRIECFPELYPIIFRMESVENYILKIIHEMVELSQKENLVPQIARIPVQHKCTIHSVHTFLCTVVAQLLKFVKRNSAG